MILSLFTACSPVIEEQGIAVGEPNPAIPEPKEELPVNDNISMEVPAPGFEDVEEMIVIEDESDNDAMEDEVKDLPNVKEFDIIAKQWNFVPDIITVNRGDTVIINLRNVDVGHGFSLPTFGVNEQVGPGETVRIEFVADKVGSFSFKCTVYCGAGHSRMDGKIVVK